MSTAYNKKQIRPSGSNNSFELDLCVPVDQNYVRRRATQNLGPYIEGTSTSSLAFPPSPPTNITELDNPKASISAHSSLDNIVEGSAVLHPMSQQNQPYHNSISAPYMGSSSLNQTSFFPTPERPWFVKNSYTHPHRYHQEDRRASTEFYPVTLIPHPQQAAQSQSLSPPLNDRFQHVQESLLQQTDFQSASAAYSIRLNNNTQAQSHTISELQRRDYEPSTASEYGQKGVPRSEDQPVSVSAVLQRSTSVSQASENSDKRLIFHRRVGRRKLGDGGKNNRVEKSLHAKRKSQDFPMDSAKSAKLASLYPDPPLIYSGLATKQATGMNHNESELMAKSSDRGPIPNGNIDGTRRSTPPSQHTPSSVSSFDPRFHHDHVNGEQRQFWPSITAWFDENSESSQQISRRSTHNFGFQSCSREIYTNMRDQYVSECHTRPISAIEADRCCGPKTSNTSCREGRKHKAEHERETSSSESSFNSDYYNYSSTESTVFQPDHRTEEINNAYKQDLDQFKSHFKVSSDEYVKLKEVFSHQFETFISNVKQECNKLDEFKKKEIGPELVLDYMALMSD